MRKKTEIANDLSLRRGAERYDEHCKRLLSYKVILAWIMKSVLEACGGMTVQEAADCIEGEPEISGVRVNPGETNRMRIRGKAQEDQEAGAGAVYFDICFSARLPKEGELTRVLLNVEGQKRFHTGYSLVTRGIYYGSRMLSSQMGVEFTQPDYDGLKQAVSVWVCTESPKQIGNAVVRFQIKKEDLFGIYPDRPQEYDKLTVVLICLNEKSERGNEITDLLNTLFSSRMTVREKEERLEKEYGIEMEEEIREELREMCNIGEGLVERTWDEAWEQAWSEAWGKAMDRGMEQGIEQGIEQGAQAEKERIARRLMSQGILSDVQIAETAGVTPEFLEKIRAEKQTV